MLGDTYAARFGGTALVNLGLQDFIADTPEQYIERAVQAGSDILRLRQLRASLRDVDAGFAAAWTRPDLRATWRKPTARCGSSGAKQRREVDLDDERCRRIGGRCDP